MRCARVLAPLSSPNFLDAALRSRRVGIVGTVLSHSAEEVPKKALEQVAQLRPKTVWREGGNSEHLASFCLYVLACSGDFILGMKDELHTLENFWEFSCCMIPPKGQGSQFLRCFKSLGLDSGPLEVEHHWMLVEIFSLSVNISKMPGQRSSWIAWMRWVSKNGENPTFGPCFFGTKKTVRSPCFSWVMTQTVMDFVKMVV